MMKKRHIFASILLMLGIGVGAGTYAITPTVHQGKAGEAPELGRPGEHQIGTTVRDYVLPDRLTLTAWGAMSGNLERSNRTLAVRFWYPAESGSNSVSEIYRHEMKPIGQEPLILDYQGRAIANAAPISGQKFPIVIVSHGFGGWNTQLSNLGEHLATRGYIVASIDHADQRVEGVPSFLLSFGNVLASRMLDQRHILAQILEQAESSETDHFALVDPERVGFIGYSMGGYGALATSGAGYNFDTDPMANLPETVATAIREEMEMQSAVDALVAIAPWGGQPDNRVWSADALGKIQKPILLISGSEDDVVNHKEGVRWIFESLSNSERHMLVYREARHNVAGNDFDIPDDAPFQIAEFLKEPVWRTERINAINQHFVTAFFDWRLKGEVSKADFLNVPVTNSNDANWEIGAGEQLNGKLAGNEEANYWKGFQRRWMTGLELHRAGVTAARTGE